MKDYYYILGIDRDSTLDEIRTAYRKLSKKFHPDLNQGDIYFESRFKDINEAYNYLKDNYPTNKEDSKYKQKILQAKIIEFSVSQKELSIDEEVKISWVTKNGSKTMINIFGDVEKIGEKIIKFKKEGIIIIKIIASNKISKVTKQISITVKKNETKHSETTETDNNSEENENNENNQYKKEYRKHNEDNELSKNNKKKHLVRFLITLLLLGFILAFVHYSNSKNNLKKKASNSQETNKHLSSLVDNKSNNYIQNENEEYLKNLFKYLDIRRNNKSESKAIDDIRILYNQLIKDGFITKVVTFDNFSSFFYDNSKKNILKNALIEDGFFSKDVADDLFANKFVFNEQPAEMQNRYKTWINSVRNNKKYLKGLHKYINIKADYNTWVNAIWRGNISNKNSGQFSEKSVKNFVLLKLLFKKYYGYTTTWEKFKEKFISSKDFRKIIYSTYVSKKISFNKFEIDFKETDFNFEYEIPENAKLRNEFNEYFKYNIYHIKENKLFKSKSVMSTLFNIVEFQSDSSAICLVPTNNLEPSYSNKWKSLDTFYIKYLESKIIEEENSKTLFLFFKTLKASRESSNQWFISDCRWCNGFITIARLNLNKGVYILDELNYGCKCGSRETWGEVEIPKIHLIENRYIILEAKDYYNNMGISLSSVNICNGLSLDESINFSLGGKGETGDVKADFALNKIKYTLKDNLPVIEYRDNNKLIYFELESILK